jgi:methyl-accepting chemotaxis protein
MEFWRVLLSKMMDPSTDIGVITLVFFSIFLICSLILGTIVLVRCVRSVLRKVEKSNNTSNSSLGEVTLEELSEAVEHYDGASKKIMRDLLKLASRSGCSKEQLSILYNNINKLSAIDAEVISIAKASEEQPRAALEIDRPVNEISKKAEETAAAMTRAFALPRAISQKLRMLCEHVAMNKKC